MVSMIAGEKPQPQLLSKKAACNSHGQDSSYFLGWEEYEKNPYDPVANPGGIIQMGLAENQVRDVRVPLSHACSYTLPTCATTATASSRWACCLSNAHCN